jgi:two-component system sensor histidine kinase VicK
MGAIQGRSQDTQQPAPSRQDPEIFDRNPDPALDELTELSAVLSNADYGYIGWMDFNRLWFKSRFGFRATEQPRSTTACQWLLDKGKPMLITDAGQDARFPPSGIPLIGAKNCRSYAGVPLISAGMQVEVLGRQVVTRLELYDRIRAQEQAQRARQRTERALAIERCFVAATLDSVPALVVVLDTAGRTVRLNHSCAQLTGLSLADAVGRPFVDEVLQPEDRPWAAAKLREAAQGQVSGPHETAWRVVGAGSRRVSWTLRPLQGPNGDIQYLIVSGQDVTDQRQVEMALHSSEARYREVVENSLGFVFTCSLEGRFTSLNAFTAETLGYRAEALTGRFVSELVDSSGLAAFHDCLNTLESKEEWHGSLPLRRSDGVYRRIACRARKLQLPGERAFLLIQGTDVTEQHEAEQALHMATRLHQPGGRAGPRLRS